MMMITTAAATTTASAAAINQNGSKLEVFDGEDFLAGLGRLLIKRFPTGSRLPKKRWCPITAQQLKMAHNGRKMEVAMVEVAAESLWHGSHKDSEKCDG